jgi:hypothetical protein
MEQNVTQEEFESNINSFQDYIHEITLKNSDLNIEERRLKILGMFI